MMAVMLTLDDPVDARWLRPSRYWPALDVTTRHLDPPFGVLDTQALGWNAHDMLRRAGGTPIRVATKSIRVRGVIDALLALEGYHGVLAFTLAEALWLAETIEDVVVGYPSADRAAIGGLARSEALCSRVTLMVDSVDQLDLIDSVLSPTERCTIRVALELDASWRSRALGHLGVFRSPVRSVEEAATLARAVVSRPGFTLVGLMAYESQIAGVGNRPPGKPVLARTVDWMQRGSARELAQRRGEVVSALRQIADLEFVNGGGTGSLESTASDPSVTEIAAGSGIFGPHLFDTYSHFQPAPAAAFALSVVRKPATGMATLLGGGWIASGPPGVDRLPQVVWPQALEMMPREMAGEVQTPLVGAGAADLSVGDRVWLRHTKAGELSEHLNEFLLVEGDTVTGSLPTYRGEGKAFL